MTQADLKPTTLEDLYDLYTKEEFCAHVRYIGKYTDIAQRLASHLNRILESINEFGTIHGEVLHYAEKCLKEYQEIMSEEALK